MKCKVGDVAVITKGIPDNIGRLVLVVKFFGDFDYTYLGYGVLPCWTVESMGGLLKTSIGPDIGGFIPDLALRPIDDLKVNHAVLAQARADAELEAAWENLREVAREMAREQSLAEEEMIESDEAITQQG